MEGIGNVVLRPLVVGCLLRPSEVIGKMGLSEPVIFVWRLNHTLQQGSQLICSGTNADSTYICPTLCEKPIALAISELITRERRIRLERFVGEFLHYPNLGSVDFDLAGMCTMSWVLRISTTDVGDLQHHIRRGFSGLAIPEAHTDVLHTIASSIVSSI